MRASLRGGGFALALGVIGLVGCGGAAGLASKDAAASCASGPECEGQAEQEIASLERQIYAGFGAAPPAASDVAISGQIQTEQSPPRPSAPAEGMEQAESGKSEDRCVSACTALASLARAVDRLCALTGTESARCTDAQKRRDAATSRVKATCTECES